MLNKITYKMFPFVKTGENVDFLFVPLSWVFKSNAYSCHLLNRSTCRTHASQAQSPSTIHHLPSTVYHFYFYFHFHNGIRLHLRAVLQKANGGWGMSQFNLVFNLLVLYLPPELYLMPVKLLEASIATMKISHIYT